jgi:aminopeptidase
VQIDADAGAETLREHVAQTRTPTGSARSHSSTGRAGSGPFNTLYDENAASHLAFGSAYLDTVGDEDRERANRSTAHADFMIGGEDVDVTGITREGERVPVLRGGAWQL